MPPCFWHHSINTLSHGLILNLLNWILQHWICFLLILQQFTTNSVLKQYKFTVLKESLFGAWREVSFPCSLKNSIPCGFVSLLNIRWGLFLAPRGISAFLHIVLYISEQTQGVSSFSYCHLNNLFFCFFLLLLKMKVISLGISGQSRIISCYP